MSSALLILGNQLFPLKFYNKFKTTKVLMIEDYELCTHFKYHKHKIIFFLAAMRTFSEELKKQDFKVSYYNGEHRLFKKTYEEKIKDFLKKNPSIKTLTCYSIEDKFFEKRISLFCKQAGIELKTFDTPMFLTSREQFKNHLTGKKRPFMKNFYQWQRSRLKVMVDEKGKPKGGKWSFDHDNRKKTPKDLLPPPIPSLKKGKIVEEVSVFVDQNFSSHPGNADNFWLPVSRSQSLSWLQNFIKHRLPLFGDYQDAISSDSDFLFHSVISPMMNAGLLLPSEVSQKAIEAHNKDPQKISLNSVEGFVRQVIGWREFVRGVYQEFSEVQDKKNFWGHHRELKDCWYTGDTGVPILDDTIKKAQKYGYTHHIERLMILSNFMLLCEVHPHEVHRWFMEMSVDSSDWVMGPNVYGMGQFSDGGIFATKPYICGSNYYLKMSHYKKGPWCDIADGLYWRFIGKHLEFYKNNHRMAVMVKNFEKIDKQRKTKIFSAAENFIDATTIAKRKSNG